MEPLRLLRECGMAGKLPGIEGDCYVFGERRLPKRTLTAWRSKISNKYLPLILLERCLRHRNQAPGAYVRLAMDAECNEFVSSVERQQVLAYLTGSAATADQIQPAGVPSASLPLQEVSDLAVEAAAAVANSRAADSMQELRKRHAQQLEAAAAHGARAGILPAEAAVRQGGEEGGLTAEKLLELRSKARLNKRQTIAGVGMGEQLEGAVAVGAGAPGATMDPRLEEYDREALKRLGEKEVRVADRNSVLRWPGRDFGFALNHYSEMRRHEIERESANDDGSYGKKRSRSGAGVGSGGENRDRHVPLPPPGTAFSSVVSAAAATSSSSRGPQPGGASGGLRAAGSGKPRSASAPAIIIVPNTPTAMVTLYNAKELLDEGIYTPSLVVKERGGKKPTNVKVERTLHNGHRMVYEMIDNPMRLSRQDWERVVCVLVQGVNWQFKGWPAPWDSPVTLFQRVLGVYLKYDDVKLENAVTKWRVKVLDVSKHRRHLDQGASKELWRQLDEFMLVHKSYLMRA